MNKFDKILGEYREKDISAGGGQVNSVVAGINVTVDSSDPANPIVSSTGGGGGGGQVNSVVAGNNVTVDSTDPANPIVAAFVGMFDGGFAASVYGGTTAINGGTA